MMRTPPLIAIGCSLLVASMASAQAPKEILRDPSTFATINDVADRSPGNPRWGLAPIEMAWQGKTVREICQQLKDPSRNGGRDLALIHAHTANLRRPGD